MQEIVANQYFYKINVSKKTYRKKVILFFLSCMLVSVFLITLFASFFKDKTKQKLYNSKTYYYLCLEGDKNQKTSKEKSEKIIKNGGAGHILFYKNEYHVVVFCYQNKSDIQKVILNNNDYNFQTITISIEKLKLKSQRKIKSEIVFIKAYELLFKSYESIYSCFSEQTKYNLIETYQKLTKIKIEIEENIKNLDKKILIEQNCFKNLVLELKSGLEMYDNIICEVLNEIYKNGSLGSVFALALIKSVQMQVVLRQNLNKM